MGSNRWQSPQRGKDFGLALRSCDVANRVLVHADERKELEKERGMARKIAGDPGIPQKERQSVGHARSSHRSDPLPDVPRLR